MNEWRKVMDEEQKERLYNLLDRIKVNDNNRGNIERIREALDNGDYQRALVEIQTLQKSGNVEYIKQEEKKEEKPQAVPVGNRLLHNLANETKKEEVIEYPELLASTELEKRYAPEAAKMDFNFAKEDEETANLKKQIRRDYAETNFTMEKTFT